MKQNELIEITDEQYFAADGVSSSGLKQFAKSPAHFQNYLTAPSKTSTAFNVGSLTHSLILEGRQDWVINDGNRRTKAVREEIEEIEKTGKIVIKSGEDDDILKMSESVKNHALGKYLGKDPKRSELAGFAVDPDTGLLLKAKFDYAPSSGSVLFDLKTCQDASEREFKWSIKKYGYDIQACHYLNVARLCGMDYEQFIFIAVEKSAPYGANAIMLDAESMERAESKYRLLLESFKDCEEKQDFSLCYGDELKEVTL